MIDQSFDLPDGSDGTPSAAFPENTFRRLLGLAAVGGTAPLSPDQLPKPKALSATVVVPDLANMAVRSGGLSLEALRECAREFVLDRKIGEGGQGEVWEALQVHLSRTVALKKARYATGPVDDFLKEAYTSAQLDHPNIIPVYDIGVMSTEAGTSPVLCMKRVQGRSWLDLLKADRQNPHLRPDEMLSRNLPIYLQVLNAVRYAHSKRIIHRDLKPAQVMVGGFGEVFLLDWGLAIFVGADDLPGTPALPDLTKFFTLDSATNPAGSPAYMAPEQATPGTGGLGMHTDIYLLGAMLFDLVAGRPPHTAGSVREAVEMARVNECHPLPENTPPELAEIIRRCLATAPADRPRDTCEIQAAVESYISGAGRKDQSRKIVAEVATASLPHDYTGLSAASRQLAQAEHLWPDNPGIPDARERILEAYVRVALEKRDFALAQLQAGRLREPAESDEWYRQIDVARNRAVSELTNVPLLTRGRLATLLITYALLAIGGFVTFRAARNTVLGEVRHKVASLATLAANAMPADKLAAIDANPSIYTPEFQRVFQQLNRFRRSDEDIRFAYVMRPEPGKDENLWRTIIDADPLPVDIDGSGVIEPNEEGNPPGAPYEDGDPAMRRAFNQNTVTSALIRDDWGIFISGFAPIMDKNTKMPVALLGIDVEFEKLAGKLHMVRMIGLGVGAFLFVLVSLTLWAFFSSRRALERARLLEQMVRRHNAELKGLSI